MSGEDSLSSQFPSCSLERRQVFISYSQSDQEILDRLLVHLKALERSLSCRFELWEYSRIKPGDLWRDEIAKAQAQARMALLLVSQDFLASESIVRHELRPLLRAAEQVGLRILWIPVAPSSWRLYDEISRYKPVISPERSLAEMVDHAEREKVLVAIAEHIRDLFLAEEVSLSPNQTELKSEFDQQGIGFRSLEQSNPLRASSGVTDSRLSALKPPLPVPYGEEKYTMITRRKLLFFGAPALFAVGVGIMKAQRKPYPLAITKQALPSPIVERPSEPSMLRATCVWMEQQGARSVKRTKTINVPGYLEQLGREVAIPMIQIPAGNFIMGSPVAEFGHFNEEGPLQEVQLAGFWMGQTPITQAQWRAVARLPKIELNLDPDPSRFKGDNRPVEQVSWEEAMEFCRRLSRRSGLQYTLPSEAQWEYACRAGSKTAFAFGEELTTDLANFNPAHSNSGGSQGEYRDQTMPVGSFPSNAWGLQDMHGSVWEWCLDKWQGTYRNPISDGSAWTASPVSKRIIRGGSWYNLSRYCRSATRSSRDPDQASDKIGFRVVCIPRVLSLLS